jgi:hypothetical protein
METEAIIEGLIEESESFYGALREAHRAEWKLAGLLYKIWMETPLDQAVDDLQTFEQICERLGLPERRGRRLARLWELFVETHRIDQDLLWRVPARNLAVWAEQNRGAGKVECLKMILKAGGVDPRTVQANSSRSWERMARQRIPNTVPEQRRLKMKRVIGRKRKG